MCYHEKYFQAFPILMAAIRRRTAENMRSTAELSIFLLILRPRIPPPIPPASIITAALSRAFRDCSRKRSGYYTGNLAEKNDIQAIGCRSLRIHTEVIMQYNKVYRPSFYTEKARQSSKRASNCHAR